MGEFIGKLGWCLFGAVLGTVFGLFVAEPFEETVLPRFMKPTATITPVTSAPYGRQVVIRVKTGPVLPDHRLYVVVESGGRYWPQDGIPPFSTGNYQITLGAADASDIGHTFRVHVVDVSGPAEVQVSDYFVQLSRPLGTEVRRTGINFARSAAYVDSVRTLNLVRER